MNSRTMESLALPRELYWDVKLEPNSPPNSQLFSLFENLTGYTLDGEDNFANEILTMCDEDLELKHDEIDFTQELIGEELVIELYDLKKENFYSPSPLLDTTLDNVVTNPTQVVKVQTPIDVSHFCFANPGASIFTSLTPPSSPPQIVASSVPQTLELAATTTAATTNLPITINDVLQNQITTTSESISTVQNQFLFTNWNNHHSTINNAASSANGASSPASSTNSNYDIVLNTQIIDDILKTAANEFFEETESQSSVSDPSTLDYTSSTDDEWLPSSGSSSPSQNVCNETLSDSSGNSATKKRTRPYGRGVEDRKKRKKEQNKNAATRYRQKKKIEMEIIQMEEQKLNQRHEELKRQLNEHKREAKYLRRLIREFYAKK